MKKHCFALDLVDDPLLIEEYKVAHQNVWPEIIKSIKISGIEDLEIFLVGNRLFMIMIVDDSFSFNTKNDMDANNPKVQEWETLMWKYQKHYLLPKKVKNGY